MTLRRIFFDAKRDARDSHTLSQSGIELPLEELLKGYDESVG
jgi:hypothetical protein